MTTPERGPSRARLAVTLVAAALGVVGVVAVGVGLGQQDPVPPAPPAASQAADVPPVRATGADPGRRPGRAGSAPRQTVPVLDYAEPTTISIPGIDVRSRLVDLGLDEDGVMETPVPVEEAGWFTPSPPPGVGGATVIAGHVTWDQEPTVFFRLGELRRGDEIAVDRDDGVRVTYEVTRIGSFPKDSFPTEEVYGQPGRSELRLITCGGDYDDEANRYLDNVIVWARATGVDRA